MANAASDARGSELDIRRKLIETRSVDVVVAAGTNMFFTVTLPVTLWFLDRGKRHTERADQVLFIGAREIYNQVDRAHRDWTSQQIEFLANIVRMWRGEEPEFGAVNDRSLTEQFPGGTYVDVPGLCAVATMREIEAEGWSLNPGRYVGYRQQLAEHDFSVRLNELCAEFAALNDQSVVLGATVSSLFSECTGD